MGADWGTGIGGGWILPCFLLLVCMALGSIAILFYRACWAYYTLRVKAGLPVSIWIPKFLDLDETRQTGRSLRRVTERMDSIGGPLRMYGTVFGTQAVVHVGHPLVAQAVLKSTEKQPGYDHFKAFCGNGSFTAEGSSWRAKRASVNHALFHRGRLDDLPVFANEQADRLLQDLGCMGDGEQDVDVVPLLQRHTLSLFFRFLMGRKMEDCNGISDKLVRRYLEAVRDIRLVVLARARSLWMFAPQWVSRLLSPLHLRHEAAMIWIRKFSQLARQGVAEESPFAELSMQESHSGPSDLVDEAITLLFAGADTSAATLGWAVHLLSQPRHAHFRDAVRKEVMKVCGPDCKIEARHLGQLRMLDAVIKETQRLYPVAPFVLRRVGEDLAFEGGMRIPQGTVAVVWIYSLHRDPSVWDAPDVFRPERWLKRDMDEERASGSFIPFAAGPRNCVGQPFANVTLRILLARMCSQWDMQRSSPNAAKCGEDCLNQNKVMQAGFTVLPAGGVHIKIQRSP